MIETLANFLFHPVVVIISFKLYTTGKFLLPLVYWRLYRKKLTSLILFFLGNNLKIEFKLVLLCIVSFIIFL